MSLVSMLRAVASGWRGDPAPTGEPLLHHRLVSFARAFDLLACPCGDPACPTLSAAALDTRSLLRLIADLWHGRAGNRVAFAATEEVAWRADAARVVTDTADRYARNLAALTVLALRMEPGAPDAFRSVLAASRAVEDSAWLEEARAMAVEATATWLPNPDLLAEARRVPDSALSLAFHAGWTTEDAAVLERAAVDACAAVLTLGIVHESVSEALFQSFAPVVALADLDAAVDALLQADHRIDTT